jgi:fluoroquinolone transport system permease protein
MSRLLSSARCDFELQARNGLLLATGFVLLITLAILRALPPSGLARLLPAVALNSMGITAFYFSAALTLLERAEGSSVARLVTPLRPADYLGARAITLAMLAVAQNGITGLALLGPSPRLLPFVVGIALAAAILALAGYAASAGHTALSGFMLQSVPWLALLLTPMLPDVLGWQSPLLWLHPIQGPLVLMRAAVAPVPPWELALALVVGLAWSTAALVLAIRAYRRQLSREA